MSVDEDDWADYLGPNESAGVYRVPLLLLAVASGFPALARPWLLWLRETMPTRWQFDEARVKLLTEKYKDTTDRADWEQLAQCFDQLNLQDWPPPDPALLVTWVPRVARYSF